MLESLRWIGIGCAFAAVSCTMEATEPRVAAAVAAALRDEGSADVIVNLRDATHPDQIARLRAAVLSSLGRDFDASQVYRRVPAFAGRITAAQLERLRADPAVEYVQVAHAFRGQLLEAVPAVGVDRARERLGLTGRGVRVAVVDSGVDLTHPDLESAVVAQKCFTRGDCTPWGTNEGNEADDEHGHGTGIAATIASRGMRAPLGFAPEAEIVAVRVQNDQNRGNEVDLVAAFDWIAENQSDLNIDVVALGMGTDLLFEDSARCDRAQPAVARAIANLIELGIIVVGAAGNNGSSTGLTAPGCNTGVITAGATYDADVGAQPAAGGTFMQAGGPGFANCRDESTEAGQIACYSNTAERVDVVVPGGPIFTARIGGGTMTQWGTSQSSAVLGGIAALLRQCNPSLSGDDFKRALVETGEPREDAKSGRTFPFVRAAEAARVACPDLMPEEPPAADAGVTPGAPTPGTPATRDAGSSLPDPTGPGVRERGPAELLGRYTGGSRAEALGDQRPVDSRTPDRGRGDAGSRIDAGDDAEMSERARGERVSSCSVHDGVLAQPRGHRFHGWLIALAWIVAATLRRTRR